MNIINKKILDLIYMSIMSEGGDGDAIWLSKHTSLDDLEPLIDEYNKTNNTRWKIEKSEKWVLWGIDQEWAIITDDEEYFDRLSYTTLTIIY